MKLTPTAIDGLMVAETVPVSDHRGAFIRLFCAEELAAAVGGRQIVQANHSRTAAAGAVRGMHFQHAPSAEMKMVRCMRGRVLDVAVDLRKGSSSFLQYHAEELSGDNARMLVIPEGFAHGFQVLEPDSEMMYLHTAFYNKEAEGGLRYDDPAVGIHWPLPVVDLSARDQSHSLIDDRFTGVAI